MSCYLFDLVAWSSMVFLLHMLHTVVFESKSTEVFPKPCLANSAQEARAGDASQTCSRTKSRSCYGFWLFLTSKKACSTWSTWSSAARRLGYTHVLQVLFSQRGQHQPIYSLCRQWHCGILWFYRHANLQLLGWITRVDRWIVIGSPQRQTRLQHTCRTRTCKGVREQDRTRRP